MKLLFAIEIRTIMLLGLAISIAGPSAFAAPVSVAPALVAVAAEQHGLPRTGPDRAVPGAAVEAKRGLRLNDERAFQGYTLLAPLKDTSTYLLDMHGKVVHQWESDLPPGNSVYLKENGNLLRAARPQTNKRFHGGGEGGRLREYSWDGELLWELDWNDDQRLHHHDFEPLPNGNLLLIAWEYKSGADATAHGRAHWEEEEEFWPDYLVEIRPTGKNGAEVVWEWHTWDHLVQDQNPDLPNYGRPAEYPGRVDINGDFDRQVLSEAELKRLQALGYVGSRDAVQAPKRISPDWMHTNSVDYLAEHDLIAISVRTMSEIWIIDHSTTTAEAATEAGGNFGRGGAILFRWGNPQVYGRGKKEDKQLFSQHDARWVPPSEKYPQGSLMVFDNGSGRPDGKFSRVLELPLSFDLEQGFGLDDDGCFLPEQPAWNYTGKPAESFYSSFISGAERQPNGNTLICEGDDGRVFEVTADGTIVWEYWNEHGRQEVGNRPDAKPKDGPPRRGGGPQPKALFRASRIAADYSGLAALTKTE